MLGKIIPYIFVGYLQTTVALMIGILIFDLPMLGIILKGIELQFLWPQMLALIVFITVSLLLSLHKFKHS